MPNRYWVGGSGTWDGSSTTHWSTSSGGASGATPPTSVDSAIFDQAGTYTVTLAATAALACLDLTVSAGTVTFAGTMTSGIFYISGSIDLKAGTVFSATIPVAAFLLRGSGKTITTNGTAFPNADIYVSGSGTTASYTILDAVSARGLFLNTGNINLNGLTLTVTGGGQCNYYSPFNMNFGTNGILLFTAGTSTFYVSVTSPNNVFSGTGTIQFNAGSHSIYGKGAAFTGVTLVKGGVQNLTIYDSNTFYEIKNTAQPCTFYFQAGKTTTITNFNVNGTAGNLVTVRSDAVGTQFSIAKASGTVTANYLSIKDSAATGGASWNANNSTDAGNNSGWVINGGTASVTVIPTNTNISGTAAINSVTFAGDITVSVTNTNIKGTTSLNNSGVIASTGTGVLAPVTTVYGTTSLRPITVAIVQNATATVTGVSATGAISTYPLNIWISVITTQTPTWTSIIT